MSVLDALTQQLMTGSNLQALSRQLGVNESQASSAITAALPMLVGAMARNTASEQGAQGLAKALEKDHDGSILDNLGSFLGSSDNGPGAGILKHVLGGNQSNVQAGVSQLSGINPNQAGQLLENLAPILMGYLAKQKSSQGFDAGALAGMLGGETRQASGSAASAIGMLSNLLDQDGDGSPLDDIGGMLGGLFGRK